MTIHFQFYCIPLIFHVVSARTEEWIATWKQFFCSLFIAVPALCYHSSCHNCFSAHDRLYVSGPQDFSSVLETDDKHWAMKGTWYDHNHCIFFGYETLRPICHSCIGIRKFYFKQGILIIVHCSRNYLLTFWRRNFTFKF